jgi:hypothetical protein
MTRPKGRGSPSWQHSQRLSLHHGLLGIYNSIPPTERVKLKPERSKVRAIKYSDELVRQVKELSQWSGLSVKRISQITNLPPSWVYSVIDGVIRANVTIGERPVGYEVKK